MLRFLLKPRWIAFTLFALIVTVGCVRLGFWQLDRLHGRRYYNHLFEQGMAAAPAPIQQLLSDRTDGPLLYRRAEASGAYDTAHEVILYGRTQDGRPGNHLLTPLVLPDGQAVIVDRGWVPFQMDTPPVSAAAAPPGKVYVAGFLFASEPGDPVSGSVTTLAHVDLAQLASQLPYHLLPYYLQLQTQTPAQPGDLPVPPPAPQLDDGPHLSYALQWFSFAAIAFVGFWILVRREVLEQRSTTEP
jgi:surfeit locus 1 family protein